MKPVKLFFLFFFVSVFSFSQNVFIKRDNRLVELSQLRNLKIHQNLPCRQAGKLSNGKDSINIITEVDSIYKTGDTLVVRPWSVEEIYQADTNVNVTISRVYKEGTKSVVKIPISEIDKLTGKKRSVSRALSYVSTISFISVAASTVLRLSNSDNQAIGNKLFIISAPTLIVSWILQATLAKKRYHFDKSRTDKKVWLFN